MARSLAVDVGQRRIGLALSDAAKIIARPLTVMTVPRNANPVDMAGEVAAVAASNDVDVIIVGLPLHENGARAEQTAVAEAMAAALRTLTGMPVQLVDERHSTAEARVVLQAKKPKRRERHDDAHAAAVILQRWLDERREGAEVPAFGSQDEGEDE